MWQSRRIVPDCPDPVTFGMGTHGTRVVLCGHTSMGALQGDMGGLESDGDGSGISMIRSIFQLYREVFAQTGGGIARGPAAWVACILISPALGLIGTLVAPLGIIGGFILGFASAWLYGAYLWLVEESLKRRTALGWGVLRESSGQYVWEVIGVGFIAWIASMVLEFAQVPGNIRLIIWLIAFVLFNPWPEVIYQNRPAGSLDTLQRSFRFMSANGPEWIIPHLAFVGLAYLLLQTDASPLLWMGASLFVHPLMVFRGALFGKLNNSNRRVRAWQNKF